MAAARKTPAKKVEISEIYTLSDPQTGEVRYVGKAGDTAKRLKRHMQDSCRRSTPVYCWITSLRKRGLEPVATQILSTWDWEYSEIEVIAAFKASGARLLNLAPGGNQPLLSSEQASANGRATAAKLAESPQRKRIWAMKRALSNALLRNELSPFARDCMRQAAAKSPELFGGWEFA